MKDTKTQAKRIMETPIQDLSNNEQMAKLMGQIEYMNQKAEEYYQATGEDIIPLDSKEGKIINALFETVMVELPQYKNQEFIKTILPLLESLRTDIDSEEETH